MKQLLSHKRLRRAVSVALVMIMLVCTSITDVRFYDGVLQFDFGGEVEAATGEIGTTELLTKNVVPDENLLNYLKDEVQKKVTVARDAITIKQLAQQVDGALTIPSTVTNLTGLGWARSASTFDLSQCTNVTTINVSEFFSCTMTQVILPTSITSIGERAFDSCSSLTTINLGNVNSIDNYAFASCKALSDTSVATMKTTMTKLGSGVFQGCKAITTASVPNISDSEVSHSVPSRLFDGCEKLTKVYFRDARLAKIQDYAFAGVGALTFTTTGTYGNKLPATVNFIGNSAFAGSKLLSIDLSNTSIVEISDSTFSMSDLSGGFLFPKNVTTIGREAFSGTALTSVAMPNTVDTLGEGCFKHTFGMSALSLSKNIVTIPEDAFLGSGSSGVVDGGVEFSGESSGDLSVSYTDAMPSDSKIEVIDDSAFSCAAVSDDSFLSGLTNLTTIGEAAFASTDFVSLTLPSSLETLGAKAFTASVTLKEVHFPKDCGVTVIPDFCFGGDKLPTTSGGHNLIYSDIYLETVELPENLQSIGDGAFAYCLSLNTIGVKGSMENGKINLPNQLKLIGKNCFKNASSFDSEFSGKKVYFDVLTIPDGGISYVNIPDSVTQIGESAFQNNITLMTLNIGRGVEEIPANMCSDCGSYPSSKKETAFYDSKTDTYTPIKFLGLKTVTMSDNVRTIGKNAFYKCYALETPERIGWNLPEKLETIGDSAFDQCMSMESVVFNSALRSIGTSAFSGAAQGVSLNKKVGTKTYSYFKEFCGLTTVNFSYATSLNSIGNSAFYRTNISQITFPSGVKTIPASVCEDCYNLSDIKGMASDVTSIGTSAFKNCYMLDSVSIPFSATWASNLFAGVTANNNNQLSLKPATEVERANVINGRTTDLTLNCFKNFANTVFTVSDDEKDETDPSNNLITNDNNAKIKVTNSSSTISLFGKELGSTKIKVIGKVDLYAAQLNADNLVISMTQKYDINVTTLPIETLEITSNKNLYISSAEGKVQYLSIEDSVGARLTACYAPADTTDLLSWSATPEVTFEVSPSTETSGKSAVTVKPLALGDAMVKVEAPSKTASLIARVCVPSTSLNLNKTSANVAIGENLKLDTIIKYDETKYAGIDTSYREPYLFTSSDEDVATVNPDTGYVTGMKEGRVTIRVTAMATGRIASCTVNVMNEKLLDTMTLSATGMVEEGTQNVMYMNITATGGKSFTANYTPTGAMDTTDQITWSIEDSNIATVSNTNPAMSGGKSTVTIKPISAGDTVLHVKSEKMEQTCIIRVRVPANTLKVNASSATVATGSVYPIIATVTYKPEHDAMVARYPDTCTYTSSNPAVAAVDSNSGVVQTLAAGKATITVKCAVSGRTANVTLTVQDGYVPPITKFVLSQTRITLDVGKTSALSTTIEPAGADHTVVWTSSNPKIATVNGGVIKGIKAGSVTITASGANNYRATCSVVVKSPAKGLKIKSTTGNTKKVYLKKGTSLSLGKYYTNADCTDSFTYKAKKNKYGTVSTSGVVTAKKPGKFKVTLTSYNNGKKSATAKMTVYVVKKDVKAKKVKISGKKTVKVGASLCLTASMTSSKSTGNITWICNKPALATVDSYGVVKGVKKGKVKITARTINGKKKTITVTVKK